MDLHIVVSIILDYHQDFCQWTSARTLNKKSKEIVDRRPYDKECVGQRMWLKQEECMICQRANPRVKWLQYCSDTPASQRWISHCRKWSCYASALYSMVVDYKADGVYVLRQPLGIESEINIPRSNGTVSRGWFRHGCIIKRCEHWYVSAEWCLCCHFRCHAIPVSTKPVAQGPYSYFVLKNRPCIATDTS